jgi:hypothetical protein
VVARDVKTVEPVVQGKGEIAQDPGLPGPGEPGRKHEAVGTGRVLEIVKVLDKGVFNNVVPIVKVEGGMKGVGVGKKTEQDNQQDMENRFLWANYYFHKGS